MPFRMADWSSPSTTDDVLLQQGGPLEECAAAAGRARGVDRASQR
jgi:hypothetical protein